MTAAANTANKADLDDGSLVYFSAAYQQSADGTGVVAKTHYAITTKFITKYNWSFAPDCFLFLGCVTGYTFPAPPSAAVVTLHDPKLTSQGSNVGSDGYVVYSNDLPATIGSDDFVIPSATLIGSTPIFEPKLVWTDFIPTFQPDDNKGEDEGH